MSFRLYDQIPYQIPMGLKWMSVSYVSHRYWFLIKISILSLILYLIDYLIDSYRNKVIF